MTAEDVLTESRRLGIVLEAHGSTLRYRAPQGILTPELKDGLRQHKGEVLALLRRRTELIDLPWPVGYGGLPAEEVARAEATNDRLGVTDPVDRRLNVMMWLWSHYRDKGDLEMARQMREAYHELRHADPNIQAICGLCEYRGDGG